MPLDRVFAERRGSNLGASSRVRAQLDSFVMGRAPFAHLYVSDQRERRLQLPSGSSNWVEGTALIGMEVRRRAAAHQGWAAADALTSIAIR